MSKSTDVNTCKVIPNILYIPIAADLHVLAYTFGASEGISAEGGGAQYVVGFRSVVFVTDLARTWDYC